MVRGFTEQNLCFFSGNLSASSEAFFGYVEMVWRRTLELYYTKAAVLIVLYSGNGPVSSPTLPNHTLC